MRRRALLSTFLPACLIAFVLFWVMQALVSVEGTLLDSGGSPTIDFVRLKKDRPPEERKRERPDRTPPEQPPPPPEMNYAKNLSPDDAVGSIVPMVDTDVELASATNLGAGGSDRDAVPLVRVEPQYPLRAKERRIEGWVEVRFTINEAGGVEDVAVLKAHPPRIFDRSAVAAVQKWKYNPKVVNGVAVERRGVEMRLEFKLRR